MTPEASRDQEESSSATANYNNSSRQRRRRRVCLFGTSANPPTGDLGHVGIVRALASLQQQKPSETEEVPATAEAADRMTGFDEIRVVPVYSHPFSVCTGKRWLNIIFWDFCSFFLCFLIICLLTYPFDI
jgi:hypothetical protein